MRINKVISLILFMILATFMLIGCKTTSQKTVAFIPQMLDNGEYWDGLNNSLKSEVEKQGYIYELRGSEEWGADKQAEIIETAISENVDVIIIAPAGVDPLFPAIKKANDANIPIILIDCDIDRELLSSYGAKVTTFVGASNYDGGQEVGNMISEKLPKGSEVAILAGSVDSVNGESRCDGFNDAVIKNGMNVVAKLSTDWSADSGYKGAKLILQSHPNLKAIFTVNGAVYEGAKQAAEELDIKFLAGTFDCDETILKNISDGDILCTFDQNSQGMAESVAEVINKLFAGDPVDDVTTSEGKLITK
ncbi:MAG: sugar ABC transporter substrate-binding protein [Clostridium butyricum]|nr:sugar ABC transporter substrate-binding protein [Clostridium butyricum]